MDPLGYKELAQTLEGILRSPLPTLFLLLSNLRLKKTHGINVVNGL